jgi:TonB-dependent Receptor Plug Domain
LRDGQEYQPSIPQPSILLSSRNYEQLVGLQPVVVSTGADQIYIGNPNPNGATNVVNFSVNGGRTSGNSWTVDGVDNEDRGSNFTLLTYPSVDAIAEFKTLRGAYSAEYGRSASGQINVITKSGTNDFHGSAYEFVRNDVFNEAVTLTGVPTMDERKRHLYGTSVCEHRCGGQVHQCGSDDRADYKHAGTGIFDGHLFDRCTAGCNWNSGNAAAA